MRCRIWEVVVYLRGIRNCINALADSGQRSGDQISGARMAHTKHHGGSNIKYVAFSVKVASTATWDEVPAVQASLNLQHRGRATLNTLCSPEH